MKTPNPLWNIEKMMEKQPSNLLPPPTGSRIEQGLELVRRCDEREKVLAERAIEAERAGDEECCWMCMASRSENKRIRDKIAGDIQAIQKAAADKNAAIDKIQKLDSQLIKRINN
jgi:hypothetical protein